MVSLEIALSDLSLTVLKTKDYPLNWETKSF